MNEMQLCMLEQIEQFLNASASVEFSAAGDDMERYAHISRVLRRFDYRQGSTRGFNEKNFISKPRLLQLENRKRQRLPR